MSYSSLFDVMNISFEMRTRQDGYTHVLAIGDEGDLEVRGTCTCTCTLYMYLSRGIIMEKLHVAINFLIITN